MDRLAHASSKDFLISDGRLGRVTKLVTDGLNRDDLTWKISTAPMAALGHPQA